MFKTAIKVQPLLPQQLLIKVAHQPLLPHHQTLLITVLKQWIKVSMCPHHYLLFHHLLKPLLDHQSHQQWLAQMIHICSPPHLMPLFHTKEILSS
ncbi:hypothetical protein HanIR_Chr05g0240401 [Helianthus annuus]|nr:hypothetical protein HanIR_Chr05g0240401 [Helianthus annuus]